MTSMQQYLAYGIRGTAILVIIILGFTTYFFIRQGLTVLSDRKLLPESIRKLPKCNSCGFRSTLPAQNRPLLR